MKKLKKLSLCIVLDMYIIICLFLKTIIGVENTILDNLVGFIPIFFTIIAFLCMLSYLSMLLLQRKIDIEKYRNIFLDATSDISKGMLEKIYHKSTDALFVILLLISGYYYSLTMCLLGMGFIRFMYQTIKETKDMIDNEKK